MGKYISKSAAVAEIEKIKEGLQRNGNPNPLGNLQECLAAVEIEALNLIKDSLDSLEVKEVNIEREMQAFATLDLEPLKVSDSNIGISITMDQLYRCAEHFFELGMRVNNPITAADRGTAEEIIVNLKRVEQDYRINLTKEIEWVRNQVKKGEEYDCK